MELKIMCPTATISPPRSNTALIALILDGCPFHRPSARLAYVERVSRLPWRELLAELRLPVRRQTLRILSKLAPDQCHPLVVRRLAQVLRLPRHPALRVLPHVECLTRDTVRLLFQPAECVTPRLLLETASSPAGDEPVTRVVANIRELRGDSRWPYRGLDLRQLRSVERRLATADAVPDPTVRFPSPPIPGLEGHIEPVSNARQLIEEGEVQRNCASTFFQEIVAGRVYIYRVLQPERATLQIQRGTAGWSVGDLRTADNGVPSPGLTAVVTEWITATRSDLGN